MYHELWLSRKLQITSLLTHGLGTLGYSKGVHIVLVLRIMALLGGCRMDYRFTAGRTDTLSGKVISSNLISKRSKMLPSFLILCDLQAIPLNKDG